MRSTLALTLILAALLGLAGCGTEYRFDNITGSNINFGDAGNDMDQGDESESPVVVPPVFTE